MSRSFIFFLALISSNIFAGPTDDLWAAIKVADKDKVMAAVDAGADLNSSRDDKQRPVFRYLFSHDDVDQETERRFIEIARALLKHPRAKEINFMHRMWDRWLFEEAIYNHWSWEPKTLELQRLFLEEWLTNPELKDTIEKSITYQGPRNEQTHDLLVKYGIKLKRWVPMK